MQATSRPFRLLHAVLYHELLEALLAEGVGMQNSALSSTWAASASYSAARLDSGSYSMTVLREISAFWTSRRAG